MGIGERIRILRQELKYNQGDFSDFIGVKQNSLSYYESEKNQIPTSVCEIIIKKTNVSALWLLTGEGEMFGESQEGDIIKVPILSLSVSAGPGLLVEEEPDVDGELPLPASMFAPYEKKNLRAITVKGDSMRPTLFEGDYVLISEGLVNDNGIYVLNVDGELRVKRLQFALDGNLHVLSDNQTYKEEVFTKDDLESRNISIIGKVIMRFGGV